MIPELTFKTAEIVDDIFSQWNPNIERKFAKCEID